jgi:predicted signal transduction protein with EAL and GGDEF domain
LGIVAERMVNALSAPLSGPAAALAFSGSVGAACTSDADLEPAELLRRADLAMYAAKRAGGNRFSIYDPSVHGSRPRRRVRRAGPGGAGGSGSGSGAASGSMAPLGAA